METLLKYICFNCIFTIVSLSINLGHLQFGYMNHDWLYKIS